jgi:hypothetical protein
MIDCADAAVGTNKAARVRVPDGGRFWLKAIARNGARLGVE